MRIQMNKQIKIPRFINLLKKHNLFNKKKNNIKEESEHIYSESVNEIDACVSREYKRKGANGSYYKYKFKEYFGNLFRNKKKLTSGYYVLLLAMVILGTVSVGITMKAYGIISNEQYSVYSSIDSQSINSENISNNQNSQVVNVSDSSIQEVKAEPESVPVINNSNNANVSTTVNPVSSIGKETKTVETPKPIVQPLAFVSPINGEIIKPYSVDKVIYSKTLELWKTHDGVDIAGNIGDDVKSMERGTVEKIYDDSFYGTTIIIDHGQGYKSMYSNLDNKVNVKAKQSIKKGYVIGHIGSTAIGEIKDSPHVHIQLYKDGNVLDPTSKF